MPALPPAKPVPPGGTSPIPSRGSRLRFVDLFAGIGGFHVGIKALGHDCVFASELDPSLRELYVQNFPDMKGKVEGDIRASRARVPPHDLLCAGFPCQPFSKSGDQDGFHDPTDGTLFHEVLNVIDDHRPPFVFLENVGNFERHDKGNTWKIVKQSLVDRGYNLKATEHSTTEGGFGLISPHHLGYPQKRERFFVVASLGQLPIHPFPQVSRNCATSLASELQAQLSEKDVRETKLSEQQRECIDHWNALITELPARVPLITPLWGDEFNATYPFEEAAHQPANLSADELREYLDGRRSKGKSKQELLAMLPRYARDAKKFPDWKVRFIRDSRAWWEEARYWAPKNWLNELRRFPFSLRKLEWHGGPDRDLWKTVMQFRPSGLRARPMTAIPALVAMTTTQIPIIGPQKRFLTKSEGLRLQGFPQEHRLPLRRTEAFAALGNAVHAKVIEAIGEAFVGRARPAPLPVAPLLRSS